MRRPLTFVAGLVVALIIGAVGFLWTPDTDPQAMRAKYGALNDTYVETAGGMSVHIRASGPKDAPALILIHGTSASLHTWEPLRARLGNRFRIIAYDQPGHGLTGPHPERDYTFEGMADALDAVFEAEDIERAVLVGNSMGGWVAWRDALENPDRVSALVLLDAAGIPKAVDTESNLGFRLLQSPAGRLAMRKFTPRAAVEASLLDTVSVDAIVTPDMVDRYWELLRYPGNRRAAGDQFTSPRRDLSGRLGEIEVPTLVLWGEQDQLIDASSAAVFTERMPNAKAVIFPGVGHLPMEEAPNRTADEIVRFLRTNIAGVPLAPIEAASDIPG